LMGADPKKLKIALDSPGNAPKRSSFYTDIRSGSASGVKKRKER
jgi:hypothetical protein